MAWYRFGVLQLVDLRPGPTDDDCLWSPPFDVDVEYGRPHWWQRPKHGNGVPWYVQVMDAGTEVARVAFDDPGGINPYYEGVPQLGEERLEIQFIEVAAAAHGRGIGGQVVRGLMERHSDRRLFAYSVDADWFWAKLGWKPFYDSRYGSACSPLFIQPAG